MPWCDACGRPHDETFWHCAHCVREKQPSSLLKVLQHEGHAEVYCACCGRLVAAVGLIDPPPRIHYPEGLPLGELLVLARPVQARELPP